jgi:hypothetical protein
MTSKFKSNGDLRDKVIAGLEKENKLQHEIIKEQKILIQTLEEQVSALTKLIKDSFRSVTERPQE